MTGFDAAQGRFVAKKGGFVEGVCASFGGGDCIGVL
jgi:hypothetical protein